MVSEYSEDNILELNQELLSEGDSEGDEAMPLEPDVLLLKTPIPAAGPVVSIEVESRGRSQRMPKPSFGTGATLAENVTDPESQTALPATHSGLATANNLDELLRIARQAAAEFRIDEARTRRSLYAVLANAYNLSVALMQDPRGFARILDHAGLKMQDRAPMTPILKLVFGLDYDKTRLTEYAAVLANGHRHLVPPDQFAEFLARVEGGIKGIVKLERQYRSEKQGQGESEQRIDIRPSLAKRLRSLTGRSLDEFGAGEEEFTLVIARRKGDGTIAALAEVPRDTALLERAARRLFCERPTYE